jgi:mannose-6-phosphate isomerase-like protein (cupin superfamily)
VKPVFLEPGAGETITARAARDVIIKGAHELVDVTESRYGDGERGPAAHVHHRHADAFYVLDGELVFGVGPDVEPVHAPAGSFALVPRELVHTFWNENGRDARFLNVHSPSGGFADYLRAARDRRPKDMALFDSDVPPPDGGRPASDAIVRRPGEADFAADRPGLSLRLIADTEELGVSLARAEAGSPPPPLHVHERHVEWFYVVEGAMTYVLDGQEHDAPAGSFVLVPPGTAHTATFKTGPASVLSAHAPSCGFGDFVRSLATARTEDELRAVRERFDLVEV